MNNLEVFAIDKLKESNLYLYFSVPNGFFYVLPFGEWYSRMCRGAIEY